MLISAGIAASLQVGKVPVALPYLQTDLSMSLVQSSWVVSIFALVAAAGAAFLGMAAERLGQARMAVFGLVLTATAGLAGSVVPDGYTLLLTRVGEGFGFLLTATSIPPLIYRVASQQHRRTALALWSLFLPTGSFLMMVLSGPTLAVADWRVLWVATSILILCVTVPVFLVGRSMPRAPATSPPEPGQESHPLSLARPAVVIAAMTFGLCAACILS